MLQLSDNTARRSRHRLHVGLARSESDILAAKQLRYRIFAEELGARLERLPPLVGRGAERRALASAAQAAIGAALERTRSQAACCCEIRQAGKTALKVLPTPGVEAISRLA